MNISKDVEPSVTKSGRPESEKAGFLESSEKKDSSYLVTREEKDSSYLVTREAKHPRYLVTPPNKAGFSDHTDYNSRGTVQQETTNAVLGESETKNTDRLETFQPPSGFVDSGKSFYGMNCNLYFLRHVIRYRLLLLDKRNSVNSNVNAFCSKLF